MGETEPSPSKEFSDFLDLGGRAKAGTPLGAFIGAYLGMFAGFTGGMLLAGAIGYAYQHGARARPPEALLFALLAGGALFGGGFGGYAGRTGAHPVPALFLLALGMAAGVLTGGAAGWEIREDTTGLLLGAGAGAALGGILGGVAAWASRAWARRMERVFRSRGIPDSLSYAEKNAAWGRINKAELDEKLRRFQEEHRRFDPFEGVEPSRAFRVETPGRRAVVGTAFNGLFEGLCFMGFGFFLDLYYVFGHLMPTDARLEISFILTLTVPGLIQGATLGAYTGFTGAKSLPAPFRIVYGAALAGIVGGAANYAFLHSEGGSRTAALIAAVVGGLWGYFSGPHYATLNEWIAVPFRKTENPADVRPHFLTIGIVMAVIFGGMALIFTLESRDQAMLANAVVVLSLGFFWLVGRWIGGPTEVLIRAGIRGAVILGIAIGLSSAVGKLIHPDMAKWAGPLEFALERARPGSLLGGMLTVMERLSARRTVMPENFAGVIGALALAAVSRAVAGPYIGAAMGIAALALALGILWRDYRPGETPVRAEQPSRPWGRLLWAGFGGLLFGAMSYSMLSTMLGLENVPIKGPNPSRPFWLAVILGGSVLGTGLKILRERRNSSPGDSDFSVSTPTPVRGIDTER